MAAIDTLPEIVKENGSQGGPTRDQRRRDALFRLKTAPTASERIRASQELLLISQRHKAPTSDRWSMFWDWLRGNQWDMRRPGWRSSASPNYLFANYLSQVAQITASRPKIEARAKDERFVDAAKEVATPLTEHIWEFNDMDRKFRTAVAGAKAIGTWFFKPYWDQSRLRGLGEVWTDTVDASFVFPDHGHADLQEGEYVIHAEPKSLARIQRLYPEKGGEVEPQDIAREFFSAQSRSSMFSGSHFPVDRKSRMASITGTIGRLFASKQEGPSPIIDIDRALVIEVWYKHDVKDEDGNWSPRIGRVVSAGDVELDQQDIVYDHGMFPFVKLINYEWADDPWGGGEVEQGLPIQKSMNTQRARIEDHMNYFTNAIWIADDGSVEIKRFSNQPGTIIWKQPGSDVRRETGLPLPQGMIEYLGVLQRDFEVVAAFQEATQGRIPARIQSGAAIEALQEAGSMRAGISEDNARGALAQLGGMWFGLAKQFYDTPRIIEISGSEEQSPEFKKLSPKDLRGEYVFEATVGTKLLRGRQRYNVPDALALLKNGTIDDEAALSVIDFPERKSVLQRIGRAGKREELMRRFQDQNESTTLVTGQ